MTYLLLQTFLLLLASYFFGAFVACLIKRTLVATRALPAAVIAEPRAEVRPVPAPVVPRRPDVAPAALKPRSYEPIQPKIDILPRPEPRPAPAPLDTTRFERAFDGAQLPDTTPRVMIVEIRPQCLKPVTQRGGPPDRSLDKPKPAPQPAKAVAPQPAPAQPASKVPVTPAPAPASGPQTSTPVISKSPPQPAPAQPAAAPAPQPTAQQQAAAAAAALAAKAASAAPPVQASPVPAKPAAQPAQASAPLAKPAAPPAPTPAPAPVTPAAAAAPQPAAPAPKVAGGDDFLRIRAIDEAVTAKLYSIGVKTFEDMARWTPADINRINQVLGLSGRIEREQWVEQAQILAKGGETYYSRNRAAMLQQQARSAPQVPTAQAAPATPQPSPAALQPQQPAVPVQQRPAVQPQAQPQPQAAQPAAPAPAPAKPVQASVPPAQPPAQPVPSTPSPGVASAAAAAAAAAAALTSKSAAPAPAPAAPAAPAVKPAEPPKPVQAAAPQPAAPPTVQPAPASAPAAPSPAPSVPPSPPSSQDSAPTAAAALARRTPAEMAAAAAAAFAAASASVTRGIKPIEPLSPLSKVDPNVTRPARLADAIKEQGAKDQDGKDRAPAPVDQALLQTLENADDLKRIRGIGVLIEKRLNALGIGRYDQIAKWTASDVERISEQLDFKGRIERENWIEQARILATGGHTEFSRRVDKGEVDSSKA